MKQHTIGTLGLLCLGILRVLPAPVRAQTPAVPSSSPVTLVVQAGVAPDGAPTPAWLEIVRDRHDVASFAALQDSKKPLSEAETLWANLIESRISTWAERLDALQIPFRDTTPPGTVSIVLGNAGGEDAFTYGDSTMGFDLGKLYSLYGAATTEDNRDRIDRFFAHEMTHVFHKAWRRKAGLTLETPLEFALWDCLTEGLGNYRSLSPKWTDGHGVLTPHAGDVLARLQPIFADRIAALADATEAEADSLMQGLSSGPFDRKWGALTVALWLAQEAAGDDHRLQKWVDAGPWGVLTLAQQYLPPPLKETLPSINGR